MSRKPNKVGCISPLRAVTSKHKSGAHGVTRPTFRVKPDFVFPKARFAIFVDGCFWHGCPQHATQPKNNRSFWHKKLAGNKTRDRQVNRALRSQGWRVLRIWEHTLRRATRDARREARLLDRIRQALKCLPAGWHVSPQNSRFKARG